VSASAPLLLLRPLARGLWPSEKGLGARDTWQRRESAAEEPAHLRPVPRVERGIRRRKLAQRPLERPLGVFGFEANDRHPPSGPLRRKPHGLGGDTQSSPRFHVLLIARTRKLLQKAPPGLLPIRRDLPGQQRGPTRHCRYHRLPFAISFVWSFRLYWCMPYERSLPCLKLRPPRERPYNQSGRPRAEPAGSTVAAGRDKSVAREQR
jgi:hypothetical protein